MNTHLDKAITSSRHIVELPALTLIEIKDYLFSVFGALGMEVDLDSDLQKNCILKIAQKILDDTHGNSLYVAQYTLEFIDQE